MKIILNEDVHGLGEEGDVRDVRNGYARNYLLPKHLALRFSKANIAVIEKRRAAIELRKEQKRKEALGHKERLESEEIKFLLPASESGKLFGSVNSLMVAEELKKLGYDIDRKRIELPESAIRVVGKFTSKIKLYGTEEAQVTVIVDKAP